MFLPFDSSFRDIRAADLPDQRYTRTGCRSAGLSSARLQAQAEPMQLQQIVGQTDQPPFGPSFGQPAQQKLPEPAPLLDLTKHRFYDLAPFGIDGLTLP